MSRAWSQNGGEERGRIVLETFGVDAGSMAILVMDNDRDLIQAKKVSDPQDDMITSDKKQYICQFRLPVSQKDLQQS